MSKETQNFELDSNCLNISEMPEYLRPREYGKKHMQDLPVQSLIRDSQQRGSSNPAFESIKESIEIMILSTHPMSLFLAMSLLKIT